METARISVKLKELIRKMKSTGKFNAEYHPKNVTSACSPPKTMPKDKPFMALNSSPYMRTEAHPIRIVRARRLMYPKGINEKSSLNDFNAVYPFAQKELRIVAWVIKSNIKITSQAINVTMKNLDLFITC
jgi:hypothetical protein